MSLNINNVIVSGRLARDSEVRATQSGSRVVSMSIFVTESVRKDDKGEWHENGLWLNINQWFSDKGNPKQFFKGDEVICIGRLQEHRYEKDGKETVLIRMVADSVKLATPSKNRPQENQQPQQGYYGQAPQYQQPTQGYYQQPPQGYPPPQYQPPQGGYAYGQPQGFYNPPQQPPLPQQAPQPSPVYEYAKQQQAQQVHPKADSTDVPQEQNIPKDIQEQQDTPF